jgi:hypothetical protein
MSNRTEAARRAPSHKPPGDYSQCACSRLYPRLQMLSMARKLK